MNDCILIWTLVIREQILKQKKKQWGNNNRHRRKTQNSYRVPHFPCSWQFRGQPRKNKFISFSFISKFNSNFESERFKKKLSEFHISFHCRHTRSWFRCHKLRWILKLKVGWEGTHRAPQGVPTSDIKVCHWHTTYLLSWQYREFFFLVELQSVKNKNLSDKKHVF